ncbi:hypothetical protein DFJ58DRAFT_735640 [Suillus subalutaceus]|uniref:uncharacterized protein n=1 Tax=Suillus subalutaceus TaxID=48586 RepID=UPI001B863CF0|nr:uncharacterized protein DFJ58DRAFT_735640 [Suillus subalutaceus]KAG1835011.1 hypothetical protein DFJ58DRAFT_735640 [Suillus subalutaceus]
MRQCHIAAHDGTKKHQWNLSHALCCSHATPPPSSEPNIDFNMLEPSDSTSHNEPSCSQLPSDQMSDDATPPLMDPVNNNVEDDESYFPIEELWHGAASACTFLHAYYYEEMQAALQRGELLFSCPLPPSSDELGMETDDVDADFDDGLELDNYGIDLSGISSEMDSPASKSEVPLDSPTFPWATTSEFITHLLFSSPRLRFSEAQKRAVLNWATALGATGVPSLHSLRKAQDRIKELVGNLTEKVSVASGNVFYINSVGKAIAKDYSNPLT